VVISYHLGVCQSTLMSYNSQ